MHHRWWGYEKSRRWGWDGHQVLNECARTPMAEAEIFFVLVMTHSLDTCNLEACLHSIWSSGEIKTQHQRQLFNFFPFSLRSLPRCSASADADAFLRAPLHTHANPLADIRLHSSNWQSWPILPLFLSLLSLLPCHANVCYALSEATK